MLEALKTYFGKFRETLCADCQERLRVNPLRILDCKQPQCVALVGASADIGEWVCGDCQQHFVKVEAALHSLQLPYARDPFLVRGLDYYSRTAFEVVHAGLGAQDAVGGGGRYDDLVQQLGGPATPAIGFAVGLERLLMAQEAEQRPAVASDAPMAFVATLGEQAQTKGLELLQQLRRAGVSAVGEYEGRPLKRQLESANKLRCSVVLVLGEDELAKGTVALRDMQTRQQTEVAWGACVEEVRRRVTPPAAVRA